MKYYVQRDTYPGSDTYREPLSLHRFDHVEGKKLVTERWDRKRGSWVYQPELIPFAGLSGAEAYEEVGENDALMILADWGGKAGPLRRIPTREGRELSPTNG